MNIRSPWAFLSRQRQAKTAGLAIHIPNQNGKKPARSGGDGNNDHLEPPSPSRLGPGLVEWITGTGAMPSRPVRRRIERMEAFAEITKQFPGELRRIRRSMAFDLVRNRRRRERRSA